MAKKISLDAALALMERTGSEQICNFLEKEFEKDAALRQRFVEFVNEPARRQQTCSDFEANVLRKIEDIIDEAEDRSGFIDYYSASRFGRKISDLLAEITLNAPTTELRIGLQIDVLKRLDDVEMDDSDGILTDIIYAILDDFQLICEDKDSRPMLFNACMDYLSSSGGHMDYFQDEIESFVFQFAGMSYAAPLESYLNAKIASVAKKHDDWDYRYGLGKYVPAMLAIKSAKGDDENALLQYARQYWQNNEVRKYFIDKYVAEDRLNEAIALLEESLKIDAKLAGLVHEHQKRLKELYRQTGNKKMYLKMLRMLLESSPGAEIELFDELKAQYSAEEWQSVREEIFELKRGNSNAQAQMLHHEGMTDRLAQLIFSEPSERAVSLLDSYAKSLPKEYVPQILDSYERAYNAKAARACNRSRYEQLLREIKSVHKIAGGKALTGRLTLQWLDLYKRRPAFCDEIRKFRGEK